MHEITMSWLKECQDYIAHVVEKGFSSTDAAHFADCLRAENPSPLSHLFSLFGCNAFERMALLTALAAQVHPQTAQALSASFNCPEGSVTPYALCVLGFGTDSILPCSELFTDTNLLWRFFDGTAPTYHAVMTLKPIIRQYLLQGEIHLPYLIPLDADESVGYDPYLRDSISALMQAMHHANGQIPTLLHLSGQKGTGRRTAIRCSAYACGLPLALIPGSRAREVDPDELITLLTLMGRCPVIYADTASEVSDCQSLLETLTKELGLAVLISEEPQNGDHGEMDIISIPIPMPSVGEQSDIWLRKSYAYAVDASVDFREIAMEFALPPGAMDRAFRFARMYQTEQATLTAGDIKRGCYAAVGSYMGNKAVQVRASFTWEDLVLPPHAKNLLRTACDYVRHGCTVYEKWNFGARMPYGQGASMIFTGPPGTGKTMAAQVMAHELGLELYKVNLASVVSKYIGETEKNLSDIFDRARRSRVVLFFDEADVLFGKRTEVKDSNDKYSNMESAFLLQKIEEYNGVAILATNFVQNFDEAFKRRMKFLVEFPFPDRAQRAELWHKVFPPEAPLGEVDYDYLVDNFQLSGSNIKNIALHSAVLAASAGDGQIEMKHIVSALRNEFAKSGKSFTRAEAGEYFYYLDGCGEGV